jgi:hypothetical protein
MAYRRSSGAADYLQSKFGVVISKHTLDKYRVIGGGPVYHRFLRSALYAEEDLDAWAESRIGPPQCRTSDAPQLRSPQAIADGKARGVRLDRRREAPGKAAEAEGKAARTTNEEVSA